MRAVARAYHVSLSTVQRALHRAGSQQRLDRIDWDDRSHARKERQRTTTEMEDRIVNLRQELRATSDWGYGAVALRRALLGSGEAPVPAVRTIHRVPARRGVLDGQRRVRRPAPPPGWYLPDVASGRAELDSFDFIEGLVIQQGPHVEVLNGVSLHGGLIGSWPGSIFTAAVTMATVLAYWQTVGLPGYAQFNNDTRFQGPHQHRDVVSRVMRLCGSGCDAGLRPSTRTRVSERGRESERPLATESLEPFSSCVVGSPSTAFGRFVAATRVRRAARLAAAPARPLIASTWRLDLQAPPAGRANVLRRTNDAGAVAVLGHNHPARSPVAASSGPV